MKLATPHDTVMEILGDTLEEHFVQVDESEWWDNYEDNMRIPYRVVDNIQISEHRN